MVRYLTPQLKRTYDRVVRTLMPWRMIDALENLDEAGRRRSGEEDVSRSHDQNGRTDEDQGPPSTRA
ncbi:hypothetical protein [Hyphomicrobium nitrativorans]|nr:hypothetical protein [Hyphomicrobium nitrativorans]